MKKLEFYNNEIQIRVCSLIFSFIFIFLTLYYYANEYTWLLTKSLYNIENIDDKLQFQCTEISEAFQTYIYISFGLSTIFFIPLATYHIFCFFAPGLYSFERKNWIFILLFVCSSLYSSFFFGLKIIVHACWYFFSKFGINTLIFTVQLEARILNTIQFIFAILVFTFFLSQFPFILYLLLRTNKITSHFLSKNRSYFYLFLILISSIIAPPDVYVQGFILCLNFIFLEMFIFFSFLFEKCSNLSKKRNATIENIQ